MCGTFVCVRGDVRQLSDNNTV